MRPVLSAAMRDEPERGKGDDDFAPVGKINKGFLKHRGRSTPAAAPPAGRDWLGGFRMLALRDGEGVRLLSRHGRDWVDSSRRSRPYLGLIALAYPENTSSNQTVNHMLIAETDPSQISTMSDSPPRAAGLGNLWWLLLVAIVAAALCLPFLRTIYGNEDEGVLLHGATRILDGKRLYADFFEFLPPGGFVLTAVWFKIAGISIVSARSLAIVTIVGIACFTYLTCQLTSRNAPLSALFAIGWVVMSQGLLTIVEHHWFTTLFSMIAAWAALTSVEHQPHGLRWPLTAGAAAGIAAMITQTRGAFAMLAALLAFLHPRQRPIELIVYLIGCALVPLGLLSYVVSTHALLPAFNDVIRFTAERYSSVQWVPFAWGGNLQNRPLEYVFPAAGLMLALVCAFRWRISRRDRRLQLCSAFAFAGFLGCFPRPDLSHISYATPLALPLVVLCMTQLAQYLRPVFRYAALSIMIGLWVPSTLAFAVMSLMQEALGFKLVWTPRGRVAARDGSTPGFPELLQHMPATPPDDGYFFYPSMPMMPFLTARNHVAPYDVFVPNYTLPSQYQNACISVMEHASWIVIDQRWADPKELALIYPTIRNARPSEVSKFEQALDSGFERVARYGTFELWHRRSVGADPGRCNDIAE
jgi:hypothetical protein